MGSSESSMDLCGTNLVEKPTPTFALVIGINQYQFPGRDWPQLEACVPDANAFNDFLVESLGVPKENVINLRDKYATREAILGGFRSLVNDDRIQKDDKPAIIIYFAGHGAKVDKPPEWKSLGSHDSKIEMICPADINSCDSVQGIPDRTVAAILNELSYAKGDNITLILDCCYSAGMARSIPAPSEESAQPFTIRAIPNPPPIQKDCDQQIWARARFGGVAIGFGGQHRGSHILLAACGRDQKAIEDPGTKRGLFTTALLEVLKETSIQELTYTSLMHKIKIPKIGSHSQHPHCEGLHVGRVLFNARATGADRSFLQGDCNDGTVIVLSAGKSMGIKVRSKLAIHKTNILSDSNISLGFLSVAEVGPNASTLKPIPGAPVFDIPLRFFAKEPDFDTDNSFKVYDMEKEHLRLSYGHMLSNSEQPGLELVEDPTTADICVSIHGSQVVFDRPDGFEKIYLGSRLPYSVPVGESGSLGEVFRCAARFKRYQHLGDADSQFHGVQMSLQRLEFTKTCKPVGPNLIGDKISTITVDHHAHLGLTIRNDTEMALYPYVFFFDPSELSIQEWYVPPLGQARGKVDPPLPPQSQLPIGYGDGGGQPWQFFLRDGEDKDLVYLKVFLTTTPTGLSSIARDSPFTAAARSRSSPEEWDGDVWSTMTATILQER